MAIPLLGILAGTALVAGQLQNIVSLYPPLWNAYQKWALASWPNVLPTLSELVNLRYHNQITAQEYIDACSETGINTAYAEGLYNASASLLSASDYIALWRRGEINEDELYNKLRTLRFRDDEIPRIKNVTLSYPSAQDLVRFAVREVYSPQIASKFGLFDDLPQQFLVEAQKVGLPEETAKNFWAAHWELPSANMGFEMFQRRIIDQDTLIMLLRSLDVMPFWREKLIQLSYNPLTRVDVRRMYGMGVLSEDEVYDSYLDAGYSPVNAKRMTEFTTLYESDESTGITRSSLSAAYKRGIITVEQLREYLTELKYSARTVEFWITMSEYEKIQDDTEEYVNEIRTQVELGMITVDTARKMLEGADLPATYISSVIASLLKTKSKRVKLPSRQDLTNWLRLQLIDDEIYINRMLQLGYSYEDTEHYLTEIALTVDTTKVRYMPLPTYKKWAQLGLLTEKRYREILTELNVRPEDIEYALAEAAMTMPKT